MSNLVGLTITMLTLNHMVACIFFLQAKWTNFPGNCWVMLEGHI